MTVLTGLVLIAVQQNNNADVFPDRLAMLCGAWQVQRGWRPACPGFTMARSSLIASHWISFGCPLVVSWQLSAVLFASCIASLHPSIHPGPFSQSDEVLPSSEGCCLQYAEERTRARRSEVAC